MPRMRSTLRGHDSSRLSVPRHSSPSSSFGRRGTRLLAALPFLLAVGCSLFSPQQEIPKGREAWVDSLLLAEDRRDANDPLFALALENDDPVVRMFAYRGLGRIGDPAQIGLILKSARRETAPELRAEAILAMGGTENARILDAVEPFALDPSIAARRAVARAVGRAKSDQSLHLLFGLMSDADPDVRAEAALGIARRLAADKSLLTERSVPAFRSLSKSAMEDGNAKVRAAVTFALGKTEMPEFSQVFINALGDSDALVRCYAAVAFQTLPVLDTDEAARAALITATKDAEFTVVVEALKALEHVKDPAVATALMGLVRSDAAPGAESFHVRAAATKALGKQLATPALVAASEAGLLDPSPSVRVEALDAIVALGTPEQARAACDAFASNKSDDAALFLRSRAAAAAANLPNEAGFPIVQRLFADESPAVRAAAIETLPRFKGHASDAAAMLKKALAEQDVAPRESAATAVAALRLDSLAPDLVAALETSPGPDFIEARLSILRALGSFDKLGLATAIKKSLDDDEIEVRRVAAEQLAKLGSLLEKASPRLPPPRVVVPKAGRDFLNAAPRTQLELVTTKGSFKIELFVEDAPVHAAAFSERALHGFYDGLTIHRLVPGFVVQGLDPRGDGYGSGGASLRAENNDWRYDRGVIGMPDAGRDTGGCQFFVTFRPQPRLDDRYTIFARVIEGMETVERLDVGDRILYVLAAAPAAAQDSQPKSQE